MKLNKGIIKNINRKIFASAITLTLITASLSGCSEKKTDVETFSYSIPDDKGTIDYFGHIDYDSISKCRVIGIEVFGNTEFFFTNYILDEGYYNIFGNEKIYSDNNKENENRTLISNVSAVDYLVYYNAVLLQYGPDDINRVLDKIKEDYQKTEKKTLVKE